MLLVVGRGVSHRKVHHNDVNSLCIGTGKQRRLWWTSIPAQPHCLLETGESAFETLFEAKR